MKKPIEVAFELWEMDYNTLIPLLEIVASHRNERLVLGFGKDRRWFLLTDKRDMKDQDLKPLLVEYLTTRI